MPRLLYFAHLRERVGHAEEDVVLPADVCTGADLLKWLTARQPELADVLQSRSLRMALDQELVSLNAPLGAAQEIALFPPMTGG